MIDRLGLPLQDHQQVDNRLSDDKDANFPFILAKLFVFICLDEFNHLVKSFQVFVLGREWDRRHVEKGQRKAAFRKLGRGRSLDNFAYYLFVFKFTLSVLLANRRHHQEDIVTDLDRRLTAWNLTEELNVE